MAVEARSELAGFIAALDADFTPTALHVKEGRAAGVIVDTADEAGADIVVVGLTAVPVLRSSFWGA